MASLNSSTHVLARLVTETESKLEGEGEKEPKGMASLNSSTHVHAGSEGSFSRRTTRRTCTPGAVSCGRRREGSSLRPRPPSACRRHCGGSSHDAMSCDRRPEGSLRRLRSPSACTTGRRCRAAVVARAVCGGCAVTVGLQEAARTTGCGSFVRKDWQVSGVCAD